jgi:hypothetical protein
MRLRSFALLPLVASLVACSVDSQNTDGADQPITSNEAQIVDFDFDAQTVASSDMETRKAIVTQLFYTIGPLTTQKNANGRVGEVELTNVVETASGATKTIKYHAKLPVAWPKGVSVPKSYSVVLPADTTKLDDFNAKYDSKCGKDEYGQDVFWHDFNPLADGCKLDAGDITRATVKITKDKRTTTGMYPEYDKVWADGALNVVAIFGESSGGADGDEGVQQHDLFVSAVADAIPGAQTKENDKTASVLKDTVISGTVKTQDGDKPVTVTVLLVDTLYQAGDDFDKRYDAVSEKADFIVYNGHSELSKNTNALAQKGKVAKGQYQIYFFDSCDTFAYLDTSLTDRRREVNGADVDPNGTKYLDTFTDVLPSYFSNYSNSSMTVLKALMNPDAPKSYNDILSDLPADQVVVVAGEEDNSYKP